MATPHWAMPQEGSAFATATKVSSDFLYQKEWSKATARLKSGWTVGEHDVGKFTLPMATLSGAPCSCCGMADGAEAAPAQNKNAKTGWQNFMSCWLLLARRWTHRMRIATNYILNGPMKWFERCSQAKRKKRKIASAG